MARELNRYNQTMRPTLALAILFLVPFAFGQEKVALNGSSEGLADAPSAPVLQCIGVQRAPGVVADDTPLDHRFWDRTNVLLFSGVAVFRGLDYASTRNFMARGRTEILIPDDVVNNSAGFAALEAAGTAASVGISYIFHRTGHHKMERWLSIGHIAVTGFGVAWNYSLKSKHPH
jgi:hypothetical protein